MERKDTLLEIAILWLFIEFTNFYFYGVLIIALQYNFAVNLYELRLQIRMRVDRLFQGIHHEVCLYSFEAIDKRNVILSRIGRFLPFKIQSALVLHEGIE